MDIFSQPLYDIHKEFCQTNGDYLLCLDAYRDYFKKEPPSEDKVKLIRFLAEYGTDNTLQAMDIMARSQAGALDYCEGYCAVCSGN